MRKHIVTVMDLVEVSTSILNESKESITSGMSPGELAAYELGIKNALGLIDQIIENEETYIIPIIGRESEEVFIEELFE